MDQKLFIFPAAVVIFLHLCNCTPSIERVAVKLQMNRVEAAADLESDLLSYSLKCSK